MADHTPDKLRLQFRLDPGRGRVNTRTTCLCRSGRPRTVLSANYRSTKATIARAAMFQVRELGRTAPVFASGPVCVHVRTTVARKHAQGSAQGLALIDVDATAKCVLDALAGAAYTDDAQVARLVASKRLGSSEDAGLVVTICPEEAA